MTESMNDNEYLGNPEAYMHFQVFNYTCLKNQQPNVICPEMDINIMQWFILYL